MSICGLAGDLLLNMAGLCKAKFGRKRKEANSMPCKYYLYVEQMYKI